MFLEFAAISQVTSLYYCKPYIKNAYVVAAQLTSLLQGIFSACVLTSLLIPTTVWICPLPLNSFSVFWCINNLWVFLPAFLQLLSVSVTLLARSRSLQTSPVAACLHAGNSNAGSWHAGLPLFIPSSCPFSAGWRARSLLDRFQNVLSELFLPWGNLKEFASDDRIQANLTLTFHFSQFKSHTLCGVGCIAYVILHHNTDLLSRYNVLSSATRFDIHIQSYTELLRVSLKPARLGKFWNSIFNVTCKV